MTKKILVLGGGTAGVVSSMYLSDKIAQHNIDAEVTLVNKDEWHYMPPLWMDVAIEGMPVEETRAPIKGLEAYGVNVIISKVENIDPANREVQLDNGEKLTYDYLIIGLGARNGWEAYEGLEEEGYHNYDPEGAVELYRQLLNFKGGKLVLAVPEVPYRCGIYPMEFVTYIGYNFKTRGINAEIVLSVPRMPDGSTPIQALGPDIAKLWMKYINKYGIKVKPHNGFVKVDKTNKKIITKDYEETYDLLVKVPPLRLPRVLDKPEFVSNVDKRFTRVRPLDFRHPEYDEIFLPSSHGMGPAGLADTGVHVHSAAVRSSSFLFYDLAGINEIQDYPPVTCAAYVGDKGFIGTCETEFNGEVYTWQNCYNVMESALARKIKKAFYQGWLDRLRISI
ncbi:MAG: FAD-dependent oxidoreductase [Desulfurococcales archaeon]|nr:FAD-dependent oxidoreductase [Desulfurococcales archaeon]